MTGCVKKETLFTGKYQGRESWWGEERAMAYACVHGVFGMGNESNTGIAAKIAFGRLETLLAFLRDGQYFCSRGSSL